VNAERSAQGADVGRLLVSCADRPGIVAAVTGFLFDAGANILSSDQYSTGLTDGEFYLRVEFHLPGLTDRLASLDAAFRAEIGTRLQLHHVFHDTEVQKRIVVLASKQDHCLLELLWRWRRGELPADIGLVISNHPALAEDVAGFGVPFEYMPVLPGRKDEAEARQLELINGKFDLVVLARYMQVLSPAMLAQMTMPAINIHHSFLPAFVGAKPYEQALRRGVKLIGATAHYVTDELDDGPIIEQDVRRVSHRATLSDLVRLGAEVERAVLARAVTWHCEDRVLVQGGTTIIF
jgi:formyltetrahydrofolate deformylase